MVRRLEMRSLGRSVPDRGPIRASPAAADLSTRVDFSRMEQALVRAQDSSAGISPAWKRPRPGFWRR